MIATEGSLWIHGWGTSPKVWSSITDTPPIAPDTSGDLVDHVIKKANEKQSATLIGWSLGGMLAIAAAPSIRSLRRLVIIGSGPTFCRTPTNKGWPPKIIRRMRQNLQIDAMATRARFLEAYLPEHADLQELQDTYQDAGLAFLETADLREAAERLTLPILHLHGQRDTLFPCPLPSEASAQFPNAAIEFHALETCGHAPFLDAPETCRQLIANFLT